MKAEVVNKLETWVPSMLVKEIRQGLNSWGFLAQFYGIHAVLVFVTLVQMASVSQGYGNGLFDGRGFFWFLLGAYFLFVVPLMSINSVSSEKTGGTVELIRMTGLGARGIVWGKWLYQAIFVIMVATSIYPYIVLFHFVSGSDVMEESMLLLFLMLGSLIFLGISVGASGFGANHFKSLILIGVLVLLFIGGVNLFSSMRYSGMNLLSADGLILVLGVGLPLMLFMLEAASMRMGLRIDGYSFTIRILGLVMLVSPAVLMNLKIFPEFCFVFCILVVIVVPWFALMGAPVLSPGPYRRYQRFGVLGRFFGRFLFYPGWVSGSLYGAVFLGTFAVIMYLQYEESSFRISKKEIGEMVYVFTSMGMLPFQVCLVRSLFQKDETDWALSKVLGVNIGLILFAFGLGVLKVYFGLNLTPWFSFIPSNAIISTFFGAFDKEGFFSTHMLFAYTGQVVIVISLLIVGQRYWLRYRDLEKRAAAINRSRTVER